MGFFLVGRRSLSIWFMRNLSFFCVFPLKNDFVVILLGDGGPFVEIDYAIWTGHFFALKEWELSSERGRESEKEKP